MDANIDTPRPACLKDDPKLEVAAHLLRARFGTGLRVLVVGCGDGTEAAVIADLLEAVVTGVDLVDQFHPSAHARVELITADAKSLPFSDSSFDLVFSYHALEHIPQAHRAVAEMRRVVRNDGGIWVGTPNRSRLFGYLGSRDASTRDKLMWNLREWQERLRGRFRNELGAHAGFAGSELRRMLGSEFGDVDDETLAYYALLHPRYRHVLSLLERLRISRFIYPSVYFAART